MTLIDEREVYLEQEKKRKTFKALITAIIVLMAIAIILLMIVKIRQSGRVEIFIDNKDISSQAGNLLLKNENGKLYEEDGKVYISVRDLASLLDRQYYNSEYKKKGEDKSKCQVRNENEYTSLINNSNIIYKTIVPEKEQNNKTNLSSDEFETIPSTEYEYFKLNNGVKYINDKIYASIDAVSLAFNVSISYDKSKKTIKICTLDYLDELASSIRKDKVETSKYVNKKLLKYGMCVIKDSEGNLGVGSYTDKEKVISSIASCKYSDITFDESLGVLYVTNSSDNKPSILFLDLDNQEINKTMSTHYDDIKAIDKNFMYFLVKDNDKYGIIKDNGDFVLYTAFDEIGIDDGLYSDITNKYIIDDKYIPVRQDGLWGLYSVDGNKLIDPQYAEFGCSLAQSGESVTVIPNVKEDVDAAVFMYNKDKKLYGIYNAKTGEKLAVSLVEVFKRNEDGENNYYINHVISKDNGVVHTLNACKEI